MSVVGPGSVPSLFVLSLPRSLSTVVYGAARRSLGLRQPAWVTGGEILNVDRARRFRRRPELRAERYATGSREPEAFASFLGVLEDETSRLDFAYKDVVNPFVVTAWPGLSEFRVLKVQREVEEVAFAMTARGWRYPAAAASASLDPDAALVEGLLRAERAIAAVPGAVVAYSDAAEDAEAVVDALRALYPGERLEQVDYVDRGFRRGRRLRDDVRRRSATFARLQRLTESIRATLEAHELAS